MKDPKAQIFHVAPSEANRTLAAALRQWLSGTPSWSQVERLLRTRHVQVNGNLCTDGGRRLKPKEVVKVLAHPAAPLPREDDVRIRYLDPHLVIVEKPAGMTSVRHAEERHWPDKRKQKQATLEDMLPRIIAKKERGAAGLRGRKGPTARGGKPLPARTPPVRPVHRLDRETSGLMAFARTVPAERHLGQQFRKHTTHRRYLAIVYGTLEKPQTIESTLVRDRGDGRRGSGDEDEAGKRAVTHVKPLEKLGDYTLVECRLETGRTHQIRIHLSENGHPLCGDKVYRQPLRGPAIADSSGAPRLALHAFELSLEHPTNGKRLEFRMDMPSDLQQFLARLRKQAGGRREETGDRKQEAEDGGQETGGSEQEAGDS